MAMEDGMAAMFPNGVRTLLVDDDAKFLKSAKELLSFLNFEVVTCSNVAHALKSLTSGRHEGFDVILVHAAKAAASGFDFRAIIESNLLIPVIYFLPRHEAAGGEGDKLLRALRAGTYVIKKPMDANEVRSLLWKVIASRKCQLETKVRRGVQQGAEDEGRGHKVVTGGCRKRKCSGSNPAGGSFFSAGTATAAATGGHPAAKGKEKDNVASLQPAQLKAFELLQSNKAAAMNGPQLNIVHPVFRTLGVPCYNSSNVFMHAAVPPPFGNNMPPAAVAPNMTAAAAASAIYEPQLSQVVGNQQPQDVHPLPIMFGPFPYQGQSPPNHGASAAAAAGAEARAYGNDVSLPFLQPPNHGAAAQDADGELADPAMVPLPQPFFRDAIDRATMEWLLSDDFDDYVSGAPPLVAPNSNNQVVLGKASNVEEPTATAGNTNAGLAMPPSDDQCEDNTTCPLRDLHGPLSEFDDIVNLDFFMLGGFTGGGAAADDDAGTTSLDAGEEGGSDMDGLGNLDGIPIPYDLLENFMVPCHKNWTRE